MRCVRSPGSRQATIADQLALVEGPTSPRPRAPRKGPGPNSSVPIAADLPVAHVRIDSSVPHLDRVFDYAIPERFAADVRVGVRVRVRLSGRLIDGLVVGRAATTDVPGALRPLERVISAEPVVTPETLSLIEAVAARYAGTFWDVFRAAVPPRHARAEAAQRKDGSFEVAAIGDGWAPFTQGPTLVERLAEDGVGMRGVWSAAPGMPWTDQVAAAVRAVLCRPVGGVLVVVPDAWDVEQIRSAVGELAPTTSILTADLGPEARYRAFVAILRGQTRLVIGTRSAVFAPVANLRLVIVWNDGEDPMWEPHAPYWNARDVAALRSHLSGCGLLVGAPARTPEAQAWCDSGWAKSLTPSRSWLKPHAPVVRALEREDAARDEAAGHARIPHTAWLVAKEGLRTGPVLVQVGRSGYLPGMACAKCREPARCACGGAIEVPPGRRVASCVVCGTPAGQWRCVHCGSTRLRSTAIGVERTAEEFGRAFPDTRIVWSSSERLVRGVGDEPALVIATTGAEPVAEGGYTAVLMLDARMALQRPRLRAIEDAAARWFAAALLARPKAHVVVTAENGALPVQALVRWDASWLAERELADRQSAGLPPAQRAAVLRGDVAAINDVVTMLEMPHRVLGPVDGRAVVLVAREAGAALATQLRAISATRSSKGLPVVTCMLDPRDLD